MENFSYQLWFAVRYVHLASIAVLTGGAFMVCVLCASPRGAQSESVLTAAVAYEWTFWLTSGVTVATGVSNLGLKGDGLLGLETGWGKALLIKLVGAFVLFSLSAIRSDFVVRWKAAARVRGQAILGILYGLTVAAFLGAMWLGLGLAHGRY